MLTAAENAENENFISINYYSASTRGVLWNEGSNLQNQGGDGWQGQRKLSFANSSTQVLEFAEPRLGVVGKGKESLVLPIRALVLSRTDIVSIKDRVK